MPSPAREHGQVQGDLPVWRGDRAGGDAREETTPAAPGRAQRKQRGPLARPTHAAMRAWLKPASPYEWVGYYLQAPCHRDPSWMGQRAILTSMGWGLAVLFVGQQTFDGVPDVQLPPSFNRLIPVGDSLPRAREGVVNPPTTAEAQSGVVTCSRTLLTTEPGNTD